MQLLSRSLLFVVMVFPTFAQSDQERLREATARNLLTIPVSIDGKVEPFVIDTGATYTLIFNRPLMKEGQPGPVVGGAGSSNCSTQTVSFSEGKLGGVEFEASDAIAADLRHLEDFAGRRIPGVVGGRIFENGPVELDYGRGKASFVQDRSADADIRLTLTPLRRFCCSVQATVVVNRRRLRGTFLIDTGAPGVDVVLTRSAAAKFGLKSAGSAISVPGLCASASVATIPGQTDLLLDGMRPIPVWLLASLDRDGSLSEAEFDGIIGGGVLSRFESVVVDAKAKVLWLHGFAAKVGNSCCSPDRLGLKHGDLFRGTVRSAGLQPGVAHWRMVTLSLGLMELCPLPSVARAMARPKAGKAPSVPACLEPVERNQTPALVMAAGESLVRIL